MVSTRKPAYSRADYPHFQQIPTRWMDNDQYGHVNNVTYYSYFDTVVNQYLLTAGMLDIAGGSTPIGLVVETGCRYFAPVSFPVTVEAGLRVGHIGSSSVRYEIGLFAGNSDQAVAEGFFVHVYVDAVSRRPTALAPVFITALETLTE